MWLFNVGHQINVVIKCDDKNGLIGVFFRVRVAQFIEQPSTSVASTISSNEILRSIFNTSPITSRCCPRKRWRSVEVFEGLLSIK